MARKYCYLTLEHRGQIAKMFAEGQTTEQIACELPLGKEELGGISYELCKKYDVQKCQQRSLSNIATFASLLELSTDRDTQAFSLGRDVEDILSYLNDNDMRRYAGMLQQCDKVDLQIIFGLRQGKSYELLSKECFSSETAVKYRLNQIKTKSV